MLSFSSDNFKSETNKMVVSPYMPKTHQAQKSLVEY